MSTATLPLQNNSIIRKVRGYFNLACDVAGKVFDVIDGPLTTLEQRTRTNLGEIRNRVQSYIPPRAAPVVNPTLVGGKRRRNKNKKLRTQKSRRRS
uniref:Uncharacterized protein n=1 Tax=viral metagenome TaxID=1070528 RepID=A0A6C0HL00_9ZZZZ